MKKEDHDKLIRAYQHIFSTDNGKLVLEDLKNFCGYDRSSVCAQAPNELQTFYCEGKRSVFLGILNKLNRKVSDE